MWRLVRGVWRLLHSWWRRDRIRVSPREGRLLALRPACLLLVAGEPAQIVRRVVEQRTGDIVVRYQCVTRTGGAWLEIRLHPKPQPIAWRTQNGTRNVHEEDIEVYPAR